MPSSNADDLPDSEVWIASGGVRIPLVDMGDKHLRNATNYMQKQLDDTPSEDETTYEDVMEKLRKLTGEIDRRLNIGPESLPITETRLQAEEAYRRMQE